MIRVNEDLGEEIEDGDERYTGIPYQGSAAGYRDMAEFVASALARPSGGPPAG